MEDIRMMESPVRRSPDWFFSTPLRWAPRPGWTPRRRLPFLSLPLLSLAAAVGGTHGEVMAQSVEGRLRDGDAGEPVQGAMVLLLDASKEVRSGFLTDPEGRFSLRAPEPGRYTVQAERIGVETVSAVVEFQGAETLYLDLDTKMVPLALDGLVVSGSSRCLVRPDEGLQVARIWEEARKALSNQEWMSRGGFLRYQVTHYRRELDLDGNPLGEAMRGDKTLVGRTPIRSLPAEDLSLSGYVRQMEDGSYEYYGPDARALLSESFVDTHCLRLVESEVDPALIGLAFEPTRRHDRPDIAGTFWLDRSTGKLKLLTFRYTWAPWSEAQGAARGRVEFEDLPTGAWVIRRWWIRMPIMVRDHSIRALGGDGLRLRGLLEEGEEVTRVALLSRGKIVDRITAEPRPQPPRRP